MAFTLASLVGQRPSASRTEAITGATVWLTGLPSAGKSTLARQLFDQLSASGQPVQLLDADEVRAGLNADLGFSVEDRGENVRRLGEVAMLFAQSGHLAIVAAISPNALDRERVRRRHEAGGIPFFEVHVATPLDVCEARDAKGLYRDARAGALAELTGLSAPYEVPVSPDLRLATDSASPAACAARVAALVRDRLGLGFGHSTEPGTTRRGMRRASPSPRSLGGVPSSSFGLLGHERRLALLGFVLPALVAIVDLSLGPHTRLLGLLAIGPASMVLTGRGALAAASGLWALVLALGLDGPDHLWGTHLQAVNLVALAAVTLVAIAGSSLVRWTAVRARERTGAAT